MDPDHFSPRRPRRLCTVEKTRPPRFLDDPCVHAPLFDPDGAPAPGPFGTGDGVFRHANGVDSAKMILSVLNHAACTLPVYASQPGSPPDCATLGSGWGPALAGQVSHLLGRIEGFRHVSPSTCLPPSPSFAWRNCIVSLESQRQLLHKANEQIRSEIDDLISRNEAESPFPACTAMDSDSKLQSFESTFEDIGDLKAFAEDLRQRIAFDPEHLDQHLYYTPADVRSFLGGLAMGPLVLLQGISGTGKTSLPLAFARAVGTEAEVIEVQAGWRDPQDLAGHYNAFEKRFYEKEFLQALYRAGTPQYEDTIRIVLLDEMNLSYPEQYFSDLLSTLELPTEGRHLVLMPHSVNPAPALFIEGRKLRIPPNVWFIGTANHDETTMDFADKTYDRSHVMEFPHRPEPFDVDKPSPRSPLSFGALRKHFGDAIKRRTKSAEKTIEFLEETVRKPLANDFEIGWGPRLERQIRRYVPVVVAAGGSVGEATDHMLAMRLLRKLKNRHDNRPEHLEALRQRIKESWPELGKSGQPTKSFELLDSELRRLGRDPESET